MSTHPTHALNYQRPIGPAHPSRWIPLARTIAVIAMLAGALLIARNTNSIISYLQFKMRIPRQFWVFVFLGCASSVLLVLGGLLVLFNRPVGRILLLLAFAWYIYSTVRTLLNLTAGNRFRSPTETMNAMTWSASFLLYVILACIILLRPGLFPRQR